MLGSVTNNLNIPLKSVKVSGKVCGLFASYKVMQIYKNTSNRNIEIVYTFPLQDTAAITSFTAKIGGRIVRSKIVEREEAFKIYDQAVIKGDTGFLLEQYRPNIYQISLGQVLPDEEIQIIIEYMDEIKYIDSELRITIPTLVAPRYIPGQSKGKQKGMGTAPPTDQVPDADFITPPIGNADYRVELDLLVNPLLAVEAFTSPSHKISTEELPDSTTRITFLEGQSELDRDIVILGICREEAVSEAITYTNSKGQGFLYLNIMPELPHVEVQEPKDYIFLIDISGSMTGEKLEQAKTALQLCIRNLSCQDTFNILAFESTCHAFSSQSLPFNQNNLEKASNWIANLGAMGGTEIFGAVKFALEKRNGLKPVILLFTDGQVGNEEQIINYTKSSINNAKIFPFGIDTSVNTYFINKLAEAGHGTPEYIYPGERVDDKIIRQFARISSPYISDVKMDFGTLKVNESFPSTINSIYDLEPLPIILDFTGELKGEIFLRGIVKGEEISMTVDLAQVSPAGEFSFLEKIWAKKKIAYMEESLVNINPRREEAVIKEIIKLAKQYEINCSYTSFVGIEERSDKASGLPETVVVPVAFPGGWSTFNETVAISQPAFAPFSREPAVTEISLSYMSNAHISNAFVPCAYMSATDLPWEDSRMTLTRQQQLLRLLATKQNADGSFSESKDGMPLGVKTTALAILAFLMNKQESRLYKRQIEKAVEFLADYLENKYKMQKDAAATDDLAASTLKYAASSKIIGKAIKTRINKILEAKTNSLVVNQLRDNQVVDLIRDIIESELNHMAIAHEEFDSNSSAFELALACLKEKIS
ncbi:MAG: VIT domain-containing protein [Bacillota bacterium]